MKYFDNAATSFPKPENVGKAILNYLYETGGPYGRSFYSSAIQVSGIVEETRELLAAMLNVPYAENILFASNATFGINTILNGLKLRDCNVFVSGMEHNAVMRPLKKLESENNIKIKYLPSLPDGKVDLKKIKKALSKKTALVVINHQSNVNGLIQPVNDIKKEIDDIPVLIDMAQSIGEIEVDLSEWDIDYAAFTGHKALLGPTGTGGFYIKNPELVQPLMVGGTGSNSESIGHPGYLPDKFEAGTHNIAGIFGLHGALKGKPDANHTNEEFIGFIDEIRKLKRYKVYTAADNKEQGKTFSVNSEKMNCSDLCYILSEKYNIATRAGLHCAPIAHKTLGTFPGGTLRISPSIYHSVEDFEFAVKALYEIGKS